MPRLRIAPLFLLLCVGCGAEHKRVAPQTLHNDNWACVPQVDAKQGPYFVCTDKHDPKFRVKVIPIQ